MQPVAGFAGRIASLSRHLDPACYVRSLAGQLSGDEAASRLQSIHQAGFQSAFFDSDRLAIRFNQESDFEGLCLRLGDSAENVERRFLDVSPSRWDPLLDRMAYDPAFGLFNFCIGRLERERLQRVPICMADCQILNAGAIAVPSGGECILLHSGTTYGGDLARVLYSFGSEDGRTLDDQAMDDAMKGFLALARYVTIGESAIDTVASAKALSYTKRSESGADTRGTIINMFVLLHEYGHVQLNHLEAVRGVDFSQLSAQRRVELFGRLRTFEFEADSWAYTRLLEADWSSCAWDRDPKGKITGALGICLAFEILHLAELFRGDSHESELGTHPPARLRQKRFLDYCKTRGLGSDMDGQVELITGFIDLFGAMEPAMAETKMDTDPGREAEQR